MSRYLMSANMLAFLCIVGCDGNLESNASAPVGTQDMAHDLAQDMTEPLDLGTTPEDMAVDLRDTASDLAETADLPDIQALDQGIDLEDSGVDLDMMPDEGVTTEDVVPVVVAQGRFGRTIMSCDGGRTWGNNHDMVTDMHPRFCGVAQPGIRCGRDVMCTIQKREDQGCMTQTCGCDHLPGSATGVAHGNGWFLAMFGWGTDGLVWRSRDGHSWEDVSYAVQPVHAGAAYGRGAWVLGSAFTARSLDDGMSWDVREYRDRVKFYNDAGEVMGRTRKIAFLDVDGGVFMMWGDGGATISRDGGLTWGAVEGWQSSCSDRAHGAVAANGTVVMTYGGPMGRASSLCISTDGARTFTTVELDHHAVRSNPVYAQGKFHVWTEYYNQGAFHYTSTDGITWTHEEMMGVDRVSNVTYDAISGTFVSIVDSYDTQRYLYSTDGTTWQDGSASVPDDLQHGIKHIAYGEAPAGIACP